MSSTLREKQLEKELKWALSVINEWLLEDKAVNSYINTSPLKQPYKRAKAFLENKR